MNSALKNYGGDPLSSEQACVNYLFKKRWPWGFSCPFCGAVQQEVAPAFTVVCRFCRKQTSITAKTIMHGSKKSLAAWMRVAWLFCSSEPGLSARKLQQLIELSCYHTAWKWLQKMRLGAALAESTPCSGTVLVTLHFLPPAKQTISNSPTTGKPIVLAMEMDGQKTITCRIRFGEIGAQEPEPGAQVIRRLVTAGSAMLLQDSLHSSSSQLYSAYDLAQTTRKQQEYAQLVFEETRGWLAKLYRGAVDSRYLQNYLDEFSFRFNTKSWPDRLAVLDHLLTGLVKPIRDECLLTGSD